MAEYALGLALDLARGITRADRMFRAGTEQYTAAGNVDAFLLRRAEIGLIGFGNPGRALTRLLAPFDATIRVYDPWLPDAVLVDAGVQPSGLEELLSSSRLVFVLATITEENTHLLDAARLDLLPDKARLVLVSRAAAADFDALYARVESGRILAAIDVWPQEPMPADDPGRVLDGAVLSAHRAGGITQAFHEIGAMVLDDLTLVHRGLPPVRMQVAARELVTRYRSRPVSDGQNTATPAGSGKVRDVRIACRAVLFDSDGVLVDSDASVVTAWRRWSLQYGLDPDAVIPTVHGRRSADTVAALVDPARQAQALTDIDAYEVDDAAIVTAVPGAAALVASIPSDARAVVTSAKRTLARARLAAAGIPEPAVLIAAEDVTAGKPDPSGYLAAAAALGVPAHLTVVVEDSVSGIAAARTAGVGAVIGVSRRALATDADVVVEDLRAVRWSTDGLVVDGAAALRIGPH